MSDSPQEQDALRDRVYNPVRRWRDLQERIRWAEQKVRRATPAACKANERRILGQLGVEKAGDLPGSGSTETPG